MAWDESKVRRDAQGKFARSGGSKAKGRNVGGTAGRPKKKETGEEVAGVFSHGPFGSPLPDYNPDGTRRG